MENILDLHRRAVEGARPVIDRVTLADLARPTPCAGWDLRTLLEHMTGQDRGFAAAVRAAAHADGEVDVSAFAPHPLGPSPAATLTAGLDEVVAAFADGAESPVLLPEFGARLPLTTVAGMHLVDTLVHGWDVAAALGVQTDYVAKLDADVVAAGLIIAEQVPDGPAREAAGVFGPALAADAGADAWTRTLTLLGRDPAWQPRPVRA